MSATEPGPIQIAISANRRIVEVHRRRGGPVGAYSFKGPDDNEYHWQPGSRLWENELKVRPWSCGKEAY